MMKTLLATAVTGLLALPAFAGGVKTRAGRRSRRSPPRAASTKPAETMASTVRCERDCCGLRVPNGDILMFTNDGTCRTVRCGTCELDGVSESTGVRASVPPCPPLQT